MARPVFRLDLDLADSLGRRFFPAALIVQEDRNLVMGAARVLEEERDAEEVHRQADGFGPQRLGRFVLAGPRPDPPHWIYRAVVQDLERRPSCRPGDVRHCLAAVLEDAASRGVKLVASEPLGVWRSSGLALPEVAEAFNGAICDMLGKLPVPFRLTVLVRDMEMLEEISRLLRASLLRRASRTFRSVSDDEAVVEARCGGRPFQFHFVPGALSGYLVTNRFAARAEIS